MNLSFVTILLLFNSFVTLLLILSQNQSAKDGNTNSEVFFQNPIEVFTWISFSFQILLLLVELKDFQTV